MKARQKLGYFGPIERAVIKPGMRSWQHEGLVAKIEANERLIERLLVKGLQPKKKQTK